MHLKILKALYFRHVTDGQQSLIQQLHHRVYVNQTEWAPIIIIIISMIITIIHWRLQVLSSNLSCFYVNCKTRLL